MINQLYTFTVGTYVVADEWNANFKALANSNADCVQAIEDAEVSVAFPDDDLTQLFNAVRKRPNSFEIKGNNPYILVQPECEYYRELLDGEDLAIEIPYGLSSEARIAIKISDNRELQPFSILYDGEKTVNYGFYNYNYFRAGYYYIMIYEANGLAQVKLIWTGA